MEDKLVIIHENTMALMCTKEFCTKKQVLFQKSRDGLMIIERDGFKRWYSSEEIRVGCLVELFCRN